MDDGYARTAAERAARSVVYQPWRTGCESSGHPAFYDLVLRDKRGGTAQPRLLNDLRNNFLRQMKNEPSEQKVVAIPVRVALRNKCAIANFCAARMQLPSRRPSGYMSCSRINFLPGVVKI